MPRNDAFAFSRVAEHLHETGELELIAYGRMLLIGHLLWAQPFLAVFSDREVAGNLAGIVASSVALGAYLALALRFVGLLKAAAAVLVLAVFQGFAVTVPTFMTEPTALALNGLALLAAVSALAATGRTSTGLLVAAAAFTVASFSVREFAVALLVAIVGVTAWQRRDLRRTALLLGGAGLLACGALSLWHSSLSGLEPSDLSVGPTDLKFGLLRTAPGFVSLGLGLLPVTIAPTLRLLARGHDRWLLALGAALGAAGAVLPLIGGPERMLAEDVYTRWGASGQSLAIGRRPELFPGWAWFPLNALAFIGSVCLGIVAVAYLGQRLRGSDRPPPSALLLEASVAFYAGLIALFGVVGPLFNDRYLWPIVPLVVLLVWRVQVPELEPQHRLAPFAKPAGAIAWVCVALVAVTVIQDSAAYDGARWRAGDRLVEAGGAAPGDVDAGLEWIGAHSDAVRDVDGHEGRPVTAEDPYYEGFWPPVARCFVVSSERLDPFRYAVLGTAHYRSRLWTTERTLWLLRRAGCRA